MTIDEMKKRKKELGFSNRDVAQLSGVPLGTVQKIFSGRTTSPRHGTIVAIEKVLRGEESNLAENIHNSDRYDGDDSDTIPTIRTTKEPALYEVYRKERSNVLDGWEQDEGMVHNDRGRGVDGDGGFRDILSDVTAAYHVHGKKQGEYTIEDWENLPDDVRAELIDGRLYYMASPLSVHQEFVSILTRELGNYVRGNHGKCRVFPAPCGIRLFLDDKTMVEPDVSVICSRDQITRKWVDGAPNLIVEILSPSNRKHDLVEKLKLYEDAGVEEYWIVDPEKRRVMVYRFNDANIISIYTFQDKIPVGIWEGKCMIDFHEISDEISYLYDENGNLK